MSCRNRLTKFLAHRLAQASDSSATVTVAELEQVQREACVPPRSSAERIANEAKVRALFKEFDEAKIERPTHNQSGMPGTDALCAGYAKLYDELRERGLLATAEASAKQPNAVPQLIRSRMKDLLIFKPLLLEIANRQTNMLAASVEFMQMKKIIDTDLSRGEFPSETQIAKLIAATRGVSIIRAKKQDLENMVLLAQEVCIIAETPRCPQCGQWVGTSHDCPNKFDEQGYNRDQRNRFGRDKDGFDLQNKDWEGYDKDGLDRDGFNRRGIKEDGTDRTGVHMTGYHDENGQHYPFDSDRFDVRGYKNHADRDGYDAAGLKDGRDRNGYSLEGKDPLGRPHPDWKPDEKGFFPDGLDEEGYDEKGYNEAGFNRWGLNSEGYALDGYSLDGFNKAGFNRDGQTRDGFDYKNNRNAQGRDISGYDPEGFDEEGFTCTGYDKNGLNRDGLPRMTQDKKGNPVEIKYKKNGADSKGYDRWGFNRSTGLSEPDAQGQVFDIHGWLYDAANNRLVNPTNPKAWRMYDPHNQYMWRKAPGAYPRILSRKAPHPLLGVGVPKPPMPDPLSTPPDGPRSQGWNSAYRWAKRARAVFDPLACDNGVRLRCSRCGRFTKGLGHECPAFGDKRVVEWRSGAVTVDKALLHVSDILFSPIKPDYDNRYRFNGYDELGYDPEGYNRRGYRKDGRNRLERDPEGYDPLGYDLDGYNREGYNREGRDRNGDLPNTSLAGAEKLMSSDEDLLNNDMMAEYFGVVASAATGRPCRVVLQEGGFATDMKGTIYADPYPLGKDANPRHNLIVTKAGIYHEIGHELYTDPEHWAYVLGVTNGEIEAEGIDKGKHLVSRMYNIIEDGRMEREVSQMPGVAATLAASCYVSPRWDERVGPAVQLGHQIQGALLYTALPYFYVKPEVVAKMTPEAQALFKELEPIVRAGVLGSREDAMNATLEIVRRLETHGVFDQDPDLQVSPPPLPPNTKAKGPQSEAQGQDGQDGQDGPQGEQTSQEEDDGVDGRKNRPRKADEDDGVDGRKNRPRKADEDDGVDGRKNRPRKADEDDASPASAEEEGGQPGGGGSQPNAEEEASREEGEQQRGGSQPNAEAEGEQGEAEPNTSDGYKAHDINAKKGNVQKGETEVHEYQPPPKDTQIDLAPVFQPGEIEGILARAEREAAGYLMSSIRNNATFEVLGKHLHLPLPKEGTIKQRYRDPKKNVNSISVALSSTNNPGVLSSLNARMPEIRSVAGQLTRYIRFIRDDTEERLRHQTRGRLDRRRFVAAMAGSDAIRTRKEELPETSMAVSVLLDLSGSMGNEIASGRLHDATMVLATTFEGLEMPYEVRGHGSSATQYKSMGDPTFDPQRSAMLTIDNLRANECSAPVMALSTNALAARPEANKLMISLTDGQLQDHDETVRQLEAARENGIITYGVFLGATQKADEKRLDALYGPGNWTAVSGLSELPDKVGKRLVEYFKLLG